LSAYQFSVARQAFFLSDFSIAEDLSIPCNLNKAVIAGLSTDRVPDEIFASSGVFF
jgi:hypothetical protein